MFLVSFHGLSRSIYDTSNFCNEHGVKAYSPFFDADRFPSDDYQKGGDAAVARLLIRNIRTARGDPREEFWSYGFSAGAQYLSRVAAFEPVPGARRYVVGGPSTWIWPDGRAAPFGFGSFAAGAVRNAAIAAYLALPLTVYVGALDNDPEDPDLDVSADAMLQGAHRVERAQNVYAAALSAAATLGVPCSWTYVEAPGIGHAGTSMLNAAERNAAFGISAP